MEELNLDQDFLMRFSCMGTQDKDVLISQLHGLLDSQLSREGCAFFLDMTNWNLQAAVGAFYDHYSVDSDPQLTLVERRSLQGHDPTSLTLPPRTLFSESWTLRNSSSVSSWPQCVYLVRKPGEGVECAMRNIPLPALPPGGETTLQVELQAPGDVGVYHTQWRARTLGGVFFGDPVWVIVRVVAAEDEGVLGLANQLSTITTRETDMEADDTAADASITAATRLEQGVAPNPFGSSSSAPSSVNPPPSYQEHPFGSGSMMGGVSGPGSAPMDATYLERLLGPDQEATPQPPGIANVSLDPVRVSADSTTSCSVPIPPQSQNQELEWKCMVSPQNQSIAEAGAARAGPAPMLGGGGASLELGGVSEGGSCSMMDEGSTETS